MVRVDGRCVPDCVLLVVHQSQQGSVTALQKHNSATVLCRRLTLAALAGKHLELVKNLTTQLVLFYSKDDSVAVARSTSAS